MQDRSDYKKTWQALAREPGNAKDAGAYTIDEVHLEVTGSDTVALLERLAGIENTDVVLEIGCGVGRVGKILAPLCRQWIGTDISASMLAHAERRLAGLPNVRLVELSGDALKEIPAETVDLIYCTDVFMHLFEWDRYRYVSDALRVLKPGGRIFYDNLDIASSHGWKAFMACCAYDPLHRPAHLCMTSSADELLTYARRAGFDHVQAHRWADAWVGIVASKPR